MNQKYRSIWSETDQTWVAAPETAAARGKSGHRLAVLATAAAGVAIGLSPGLAGATSKPSNTSPGTPANPVPGTVGLGGLELCGGANGYSWGSSGGSEAVDCSVDGQGTTDGLAFSLNNAADSKGGYGFGASTAQIAGYANGTVNIKGASVMVYGPTTFDSVVTMSNERIVQLAPGVTPLDALNVSQMQSAGFEFDPNGLVLNRAVTYDVGSIENTTPTISLATTGRDSGYFIDPEDRGKGRLPEGTRIQNVADAVVDTDAVNKGQVSTLIAAQMENNGDRALAINAARRLAASATGSGVESAELTKSYTTAAFYSQVAGLGDSAGSAPPSDIARAQGAGSIAIGSNAYSSATNSTSVGVQAYASADDAVALGSGSVANQDNTVSVGNDGTSSYTAYDENNQPYTISHAANLRRVVNMAAGQSDNDAVAVVQLKSVLSAIGGGAALNADGTITAPTFSVGGQTMSSVGAALANLDTRVTQNAADIQSISNGGTAAPGPADGQQTAIDNDALHYDNADHTTVTLKNADGGNVTLAGLNDATLQQGSTEAVTGQQLFEVQQQINNQVSRINEAVQNIGETGSTAVAVNSTSGPAAAAGTQSVAVGGGAVASAANTTAIGDNANASAANSVAIGANSVANRENAVSVGQEGAERQIVNVAAGRSDTDAVNVRQMNDTMSQQSAAFNQQLTGIRDQLHTVQKNAYAGIAAAMAMPNLTPSGPGRTVVAAGGGYYKGGSAAAVGVTYRSTNSHWLVNGAVAVTNNGDAGARAQIGYEF